MPKVSVILTSYNHEKYIYAAIESVLNQTFKDFELLIVDDGSADNSRKIIRSYKDKRIKFFLHEKNIGAVQRVLECRAVAVGKYIAFQHSDDIWELTKLEKQVNFLENNPQYEACFTLAKFIDEYGENYALPENHAYKNIFKHENRPREEWLNFLFWRSNCFCNPSMLTVNKAENFVMAPYLFQLPDYFMWINFCLKKSPYVLQEELIKFRLRRGDQNSVSSWSLEKIVRVYNEYYVTAKAFLPLTKDKKFFLKVFPEAKEFLIDGKIITEFAFAQLCFKRGVPAFQKLALEILYDLLHNDRKRNLLKNLYAYDAKTFIQDTGKFDIFGTKAQLNILICRLFLDFGEGFSGENMIVNPVATSSDGNFTATFDFHADREICRLRFDPDEKFIFAAKILKITVNGEIIENFTSNAAEIIDGYCYTFEDIPFFIVNKNISAANVHVEISGYAKKNVFQNFKNFLEQNILAVQQKDSELQRQINTIQELNDTILKQAEEINSLKNLQKEILNSNSWKLTKPLRLLGSSIKNFRGKK